MNTPTNAPVGAQKSGSGAMRALPAEVREAIAHAYKHWFMAGKSPVTDAIEDALAPLWADAQRDKERLDWLETEMDREHPILAHGPVSLFRREEPITRAAIDQAMKESRK